MIPETVGGGGAGQEVEPAVPEIPHKTAPLGGRALLDPITTAVKLIEPPSVGLPEALRKTRGVATETVVEFEDEVAATELYRESPGNVNAAE